MIDQLKHFKRHWRDYLTLNNAVISIAIIIAISWIWGAASSLQQNFALQQELDSLQQQNANLKLHNQNLTYKQTYYQSDEYLELAARKFLGLARPGEKLVILAPSDTGEKPKSTSQANSEVPTSPSNFNQWMTFLFGSKNS